MKTSKLDLIAMQKQFDDILSKLTKEEVEEYCNEINSIKTRIGYKENHPVISEEEIKDFAENDYGSPEVEQTSDLESILYKGYMSGYNDGFKKGLSLSSNDKQEKKHLSEITDEEKGELLRILWPTAKTATIKDVSFCLRVFEDSIIDWSDSELEPKIVIKVYQYLQFKGYNVPVYYPEKKGESND